MPKVYNRATDGIPPRAVYVGRPSKWGNPYRIRKDQTREQALARYRDYLLAEIAAGRLNPKKLRGRDLVCWCASLPCHADILLEMANRPQAQ